MRCKKCYQNFRSIELYDGVCSNCQQSSGGLEVNKDIEKILITTEKSLSLDIKERFGVISSECVLGLNLFKDFFSSVVNIVGGRDQGFQKALNEAKTVVLYELKRQAYEKGANAVIAVDLKYSEISGGGKSMLFVVATGTVVNI